jgi:hypothetical protein
VAETYDGELFEVLLVDGGQRWHAGVVVGEETDLLLARKGKVLVFGSRAGLEHAAQQAGLELSDELPDEIDLDLGGWLPRGTPEPTLQEVSELWHLLVDDPAAGRPLAGEDAGEAYDDLVEEAEGWFDEHGALARRALADAVRRLRARLDTR